MTKILVFSDSHGEFEDMRRIIDQVHPDAEYVIHLGDGAADVDRISPHFPRQAFVGIKGNCDWFSYSAYNGAHRMLDMEGVRIFICHGHKHGVKGGDRSVLVSAARSLNADIALFGHTHRSEYYVDIKNGGSGDESKTEERLHVLNPGSISYPRGGEVDGRSYGIIELNGRGGIKISLCAV